MHVELCWREIHMENMAVVGLFLRYAVIWYCCAFALVFFFTPSLWLLIVSWFALLLANSVCLCVSSPPLTHIFLFFLRLCYARVFLLLLLLLSASSFPQMSIIVVVACSFFPLHKFRAECMERYVSNILACFLSFSPTFPVHKISFARIFLMPIQIGR